MAPSRLIICTYLCFAMISKVESDWDIASLSEDLVDEYYTTGPKPNNDYLPQDELDAQTIMDSNKKEEVIAGIFCYRDKIRRFAIHQRMLTKLTAYVSWETGTHHHHYWHTEHYWPNKWYQPQRSKVFLDLCFGLLEHENVVLAQYLDTFFWNLNETWIIIGMILTKDMGGMIYTYDNGRWYYSFKERRKAQRHPFENMLRVWVRQNRETIEAGELNKDDVKKDADTLKKEYDSGSWHQKNRDQLELILMKKSIKYARAVIAEFETAVGGKKLEDIIYDNVHGGCKINHDLADAYASLALYIKDRYTYIADLMRMHSKGWDQWAAWIMCIAVIHPQEWPKVDQAFQKDHKDGSLSQFILQKLTFDKVIAEMFAVIVDPNFKPTTFSGNLDEVGSLPIPTPPPVVPTAPTPAPV